MNAIEMLAKIIEEKKGETSIVPIRNVRPVAGRRVDVEGKVLELGAEASRKLEAWLGYPPSLRGRLRSTTEQQVLDELARAASLPTKVRVTREGDSVVGLTDASRVVLSNDRVAEAILETDCEEFPLRDTRVHHHHATEEHLHIEFAFDLHRVEPRRGDIVSGGLEITGSASGLRPLTVRNSLHRLSCSNGMVSRICRDEKRLRVRSRRGTSPRVEWEMIQKFKEVVRVGHQRMKDKLKAVTMLADQRINAVDFLNEFAREHRLSETTRKQLFNALAQDEHAPSDNTQYGVVNAVSRVATHGQGLRPSVRGRLAALAGTLAYEPLHFCPTCHRMLHPRQSLGRAAA